MSPKRESSLPPRRRVFGVIVMMSLLGHFDAANLIADNWPGFLGGSQAGGVTEGQLPDNLDRDASRWIVDLGSRDVGSMAVQDGMVYVLATDPDAPRLRLISIDLKTGKTRWTKSFANAQIQILGRTTIPTLPPRPAWG